MDRPSGCNQRKPAESARAQRSEYDRAGSAGIGAAFQRRIFQTVRHACAQATGSSNGVVSREASCFFTRHASQGGVRCINHKKPASRRMPAFCLSVTGTTFLSRAVCDQTGQTQRGIPPVDRDPQAILVTALQPASRWARKTGTTRLAGQLI